MTTNQPLSLFISSKMQELIEERRAVQDALSDYHMNGWLWEKDAGARPESIRHTYLKEVEACDLYIGLFWLGYGPYTIEEFEHARVHKKPCLVYEKHEDVERRDPQLKAFLERIGKVDNPKGLTICWFKTTEELAGRVQADVVHLLTESFREKQQAASQLPKSIAITADHGSVAAYKIEGNITLNNQRQADDKS